MSYEISGATALLLKESRQVAQRLQLTLVSPLCLLLSALADGRAFAKLLTSLQLDANELAAAAKEALGVTGETALPDTDEGGAMLKEGGSQPDFDADCLRIVKLSVLEEKLTGGKVESSIIMVLSILHDRDNEAKRLLTAKGLTYQRIADSLKKSPGDVFNFPDDPETDAPGENGESAGKGGEQGREPKSWAEAMARKYRKNNEKGSETVTSDTPVIDKFGTDLTAAAQRGALDPVVGREREVMRLIEILSRRKKNNPIIIGEPGVGKSAIVEGLATRIATRKVPHLLVGKRIVALDMASIVAGTQYRGQFEERLRRLIEELKAHPEVMLFVDEIHTIIGAGSAPGSLDAANILKPALARGEVQCIGATTTDEFKKTIEKDGALDRRFQKIMLEPTTAEETLTILRNIKGRYEAHHNVTYTDRALEACVNLTSRYITDRALPDKAIDALDEGGARMHLQTAGVPKEIEEKEKEIDRLRDEKLQAAREQNYELAARLRDQVQQLSTELDELTAKWQEEQKQQPAIVDEGIIAEVVSMMSGVPVTRVALEESQRLAGMREALGSKVISQEKAIDRLTRAIMRSRLGLKGADRPIGTFLFVGPTGVGKTHLVNTLAEWMFGSKDSLIRIDMSEYGEKYSVSRLVGAPPGYVGYEEGGQLTERVRRKPYSVILLDEIEKAHPDVFNILLQVMDEGRLTDGNGSTVDFRNTVIILTSNSGTRRLSEFGGGVGFDRPRGEMDSTATEEIIRKALRKQFSPEFLNRLDDIIVFNPLNRESAAKIVGLLLGDLTRRLATTGLKLDVASEVSALMVDKGFDAKYGARALKRTIQQLLEDPVCDYMMAHREASHIIATAVDGKVNIAEPTAQGES